MSRATFRLVLLVSCAHALVHFFELSLPSVEQLIGDEFSVGRDKTGTLGTVWRIPYGVGAVLAGWLVDRHGAKPLLLIYLLGCSLTAVVAGLAGSLNAVFVAMLAMGCFASIYHPAGLALISRETTPETRGSALGWHGVFGSAGIAFAPFLAGLVFGSGDVSWRQYYFLLAVPAIALMAVMLFRMKESSRSTAEVTEPDPAEDDDSTGNWPIFALVVLTGVLSGFVYAAFMHFLPRYLDSAGFESEGVSAESMRNRLAAMVLAFGIAGQSIAGRLARPGRLEWMLAAIHFANAPLLIWVAFASGPSRVVATCLLALVHFMNQPVYNSLLADFIPLSRRSFGYGVSNMAVFSIGGLGPIFAGYAGTDLRTYLGLAFVALIASVVALGLFVRKRRIAAMARAAN